MAAKQKTSEDYAFEALAAKLDTIIVYDRQEELDKWLDRYKPSETSRLDNIGWISMECEGGIDESQMDYENLHKEWQELKESGNPVDFFSIKELARKNGILCGSWMFAVVTGEKVDLLWKKVAKQFAHDAFSGLTSMVRVTPMNPEDREREHVITVKHGDFTNEEEVHKLNDALRSAGVRRNMWYKPDVYSSLGIYRNNQFKIVPSIYTSRYDVLKRVSTLERHFLPINSEEKVKRT